MAPTSVTPTLPEVVYLHRDLNSVLTIFAPSGRCHIFAPDADVATDDPAEVEQWDRCRPRTPINAD
jgi:hypothetical protein